MIEGALGWAILLVLAGSVQLCPKLAEIYAMAAALGFIFGLAIFVVRGDFFQASPAQPEDGCGWAVVC